MSTIFTRETMGIPAGGDPSKEFDHVRAFINDLCISHLRFVNEFSVNYLREYASRKIKPYKSNAGVGEEAPTTIS